MAKRKAKKQGIEGLIEQSKLDGAASVFRAIAHPLRLTILAFIDQKEEVNVNKIYNTLKLEQSITSQHLRILRQAELVETVREGKFIRYGVNYDKVRFIVEQMEDFLGDE